MKHKYYQARTWSQCPYCGYKNVSVFDMVQYPEDIFVTCSAEDGGCDKKYIIRVSWIAKAEVLSLKPEYYHQDFYAESKLFAETAYYDVTTNNQNNVALEILNKIKYAHIVDDFGNHHTDIEKEIRSFLKLE